MLFVRSRLAWAAMALAALAATACGGDASPSPGGATVADHPGRQPYVTYCASCHGVAGEGQPNWAFPGADGLLPAPPHDNTGHTWHHGDGYLFRVTKQGGAAFTLPGGVSGMPGFDAQLTDAEIRDVIVYIKGFWGEDERAFQASASRGDPFPP